MKFYMYFKNIKNMQCKAQICKIYGHINFFNEKTITQFVTKFCPS